MQARLAVVHFFSREKLRICGHTAGLLDQVMQIALLEFVCKSCRPLFFLKKQTNKTKWWWFRFFILFKVLMIWFQLILRLERKRFRKRGVSLLANAKLKKILLSYIHGDIIKLWRSSYARFQDNNTWPKKKERP